MFLKWLSGWLVTLNRLFCSMWMHGCGCPLCTQYVVLKVYCFWSLTMPVQHKSIPRFSVISSRLGALCGIFLSGHPGIWGRGNCSISSADNLEDFLMGSSCMVPNICEHTSLIRVCDIHPWHSHVAPCKKLVLWPVLH